MNCINRDTACTVERRCCIVCDTVNILKYNLIHTTLYRFCRFRCESVSILKPIQNDI